MKIIISEDKLNALIEAREEITYFSFFTHIKNFLKKLLEDPVNAEASDQLKGYLNGNSKQIIEKLIDADIIRRKNNIKETPKEATDDGKSKVRMSIQYSIPKENFKEKIHKLFDKEINESKSVFSNEDFLKQQILDNDKDNAYKTRGGIKENLEGEYLDKYFGNSLKKYLNMSDDEKENNIIWYEGNFTRFDDFLTREGYFDEFDEDEANEIERMCCDYDDTLALEIINGKYSTYRDEFVKWLEWNCNYNNNPTSSVMDYTRDVNNEWLIHFSDNAADIWRNGFIYATNDIDYLAYSGAGSTNNKDSEGYDFAYLASEFMRYAFDDYHGTPKYGNEAVMFRASGVKATHFGDEEEQVMFYNKDAKDIVYLQNGYDGWYVESNSGRPMYVNDDLGTVVEWVENNFDQYRKHLVNPKEHKIIRNNNKTSSYGGV